MSFSPPIPPPPKRILIIKPSAIGDVVHALPVLPRLKKLWPDAKLSWLITPACAALVQRHPLVDEVILFERKRWGRGWYNPAALLDLTAFLFELRQKKFDLVIDLQGLFRSARNRNGQRRPASNRLLQRARTRTGVLQRAC